MSAHKHPKQHSRQANSFVTHQTIVRMFGKHSIIVRLTGAIRMDQLNKKSRMFVSRKLGHHPTYHHFWFCTPSGVILTITGNKPELTALYEYFEAESSPFYEHGEILFKGIGKVSYRRILDKLLSEVIFPSGVRSFGGSIVDNIEEYADALLEAYQK